jgi:hypothetical protein
MAEVKRVVESTGNEVAGDAIELLDDWQEPSEEQQQQPQPQPEEEEEDEVKVLSEKLGVNLDEPEEKPSEEEKEPEKKPPTSAEFDVQFKERFGVEPTEALYLVNELLQFKQVVDQIGGMETLVEFRVRQQEKELQQSWDVDDAEFTSRMEMVRGYFKELSPAKQAALDNPDGARLIWAYLEKSLPGDPSKNPARSRRPAAKTAIRGKKQIRLSDLANMSDEEYASFDWDSVSPDEIEYDVNRLR